MKFVSIIALFAAVNAVEEDEDVPTIDRTVKNGETEIGTFSSWSRTDKYTDVPAGVVLELDYFFFKCQIAPRPKAEDSDVEGYGCEVKVTDVIDKKKYTDSCIGYIPLKAAGDFEEPNPL